MKIAVLGGTGFMGYDFIRLLIARSDLTPLVYCTSPTNLSNLARHEVEVKFTPYSQLATQRLEADVSMLVNFAHPFSVRDGLSPSQQIDTLVKFFRKSLKDNLDLKMIHISTMSVYEPFGDSLYFSENSPLKPPKSDAYASNKCKFEQALRMLPGIAERLLILRPTVVYGPFGRVWTDNLLSAFFSGDVAYWDLSGRIQPIFVQDISHFLLSQMNGFCPGILNLGGPEVLTWYDFLDFFAGIAGKGTLRRLEQEPEQEQEKRRKGYASNFVELLNVIIHERSFRNLVRPVTKLLPPSWKCTLKSHIDGFDKDKTAFQADSRSGGTYCKAFFSRDRLVSMDSFSKRYPCFVFTKLSSKRDILSDYFYYRFSDKMYR